VLIKSGFKTGDPAIRAMSFSNRRKFTKLGVSFQIPEAGNPILFLFILTILV
jgi:hypothetical protein